MISRLLSRLFRSPRLFNRGTSVHRDGWSLAEQLLGRPRDEDTSTPDRYTSDPRWSPEAIAAAAAELDRRAGRIASAESRRRPGANVTQIRKIRRRRA